MRDLGINVLTLKNEIDIRGISDRNQAGKAGVQARETELGGHGPYKTLQGRLRGSKFPTSP